MCEVSSLRGNKILSNHTFKELASVTIGSNYCDNNTSTAAANKYNSTTVLGIVPHTLLYTC